MPATVDYESFTCMLKTAAAKIITNRDHLSKLDAAIGDGDHGTAMSKVANAITATVDAHDGNDLKKLLKAIGWAAMSTDAGSTRQWFP